MFDIRSSEEADGERRIIGSERFEETAPATGFDSPAAGRAAS